jgi:hypothetical protein
MVLITERQFVQRRKLIVGTGRWFQRTLHLPQYLCAFTTDDPGITKNALRKSAMVMMASLTVASLFVGPAFYINGLGDLRNPFVLGFGIVNPIFFSSMVWIVLAITKQPEPSSTRLLPDLEKATQSSDMIDDDETEMIETLSSIWEFPPCGC